MDNSTFSDIISLHPLPRESSQSVCFTLMPGKSDSERSASAAVMCPVLWFIKRNSRPHNYLHWYEKGNHKTSRSAAVEKRSFWLRHIGLVASIWHCTEVTLYLTHLHRPVGPAALCVTSCIRVREPQLSVCVCSATDVMQQLSMCVLNMCKETAQLPVIYREIRLVIWINMLRSTNLSV